MDYTLSNINISMLNFLRVMSKNVLVGNAQTQLSVQVQNVSTQKNGILVSNRKV